MLKILQKTCFGCHLIEQPGWTVLSVYILRLVGYAAPTFCSGKRLNLAQVPLFGKEELPALLNDGIQIGYARMKTVLIIECTPMLVAVSLDSILDNTEGFLGRVSVFPDCVDDHLNCVDALNGLPFPITCHLMGIHKRLSVYFQLFMIFGYKLVKNSDYT